MSFDPETLRADFPILSRTIRDKPLIYLDNAASTQKPNEVMMAMADAMRLHYANVHRGLHTLANESTELFEGARNTVAGFINAQPSDIVFTKSGTESINLVAATLGLGLQADDEILITQMEHHSNIVPWHFLRERKGVKLRFAPVLDTGALDIEAMLEMIGPRTRLVAFTHISNVLGTINPVTTITEAAHAVGAKVLVDGCQGGVHLPVDVKALGCDFYVMTGHKLYGPTGIGVLYGTADALAALPPYQGGGEMIASVTEDHVFYADGHQRFEAGTPPILEAIGLGAALGWLSRQDRLAGVAHEHALYQRVKSNLSGANWLTEMGTTPGKAAIFTFSVEGVHAHDIAQILDQYGIAVRAGAHCAEPLMRRFGVKSSTRASFALYNTLAEADAFCEALDKAHKFFV